MHTIRLREPWEAESLPGRCVFRRHFNCPTGLTARDRVQLAIESLPDNASVQLNGQSLESQDVTALLKSRNQIVIEIAGDVPLMPRPFGEVRLEIHS